MQPADDHLYPELPPPCDFVAWDAADVERISPFEVHIDAVEDNVEPVEAEEALERGEPMAKARGITIMIMMMIMIIMIIIVVAAGA